MDYEKKIRDYMNSSEVDQLYKSMLSNLFPELVEPKEEKARRSLLEFLEDLFKLGKNINFDRWSKADCEEWVNWVMKQGEQKPVPAWSADEEELKIALNTLEEAGQYNSAKWLKNICLVPQTMQKSWSEEDKQYFNFLEKLLNNLQVKSTENEIKKGTNSNSEYYFKVIQWLKSLKDRVQPQPKQEWSDKDKKLIDDTCHLINTLASGYGEKVTEPITFSGTQMIASIKDRLRALVDNRPQSQWKPSKEMLEALYRAIPKNVMEISEDEMLLDKLYQGLKYGKVLSKK